ncbi:MAG: hypothetical protein JXQ73_29110 [Phycisphaerae bacterium]|nr:hypothetical protein [Phycisphaerae bacterium]
MAKRKKSRSKTGPSLTTRLGARLAAISWMRVMRGALSLTALAILAVGAAYGLPVVETYVAGLPQYQAPLAIELVDPPEWLEANAHVAQDIVERCGVVERDRRLTPGLAKRAVDSLSHVGWIRQVHEVSIGADNVIRICCDYREPLAWVSHGGFYYLVDEEHVRLPGRYSHEEVDRDSGLLLVMGVVAPPPDEGARWEGADLKAGVKMVRLLRDKPYFDQITGVIVANYGGRLDRRASHIELATDRDARIRWGRAPGEEVDEPTAEEKLAHLQGIWRDHDRVDMGRPWVDIQVWPDRVHVPCATMQPGIGRQS